MEHKVHYTVGVKAGNGLDRVHDGWRQAEYIDGERKDEALTRPNFSEEKLSKTLKIYQLPNDNYFGTAGSCFAIILLL